MLDITQEWFIWVVSQVSDETQDGAVVRLPLATVREECEQFHVICESLLWNITVMSYKDNLLKPKVCNNLQLIEANFIKNIYKIDWTMVKSNYQWCADKTDTVIGIHF